MTTSVPETPFAEHAPAQHLERAAAALTAPGFTVELLDDVAAARARVEEHCLPLETARTQKVHGWPSAINHLLILNADFQPGRGTILLLREAIGF